MPQLSSTLAHFRFCGSQWRWMCPLHYSLFWVKCWTHVSHSRHGFGETVCSSFTWLNSKRAPAHINYCELPSRFLVPTMRTHTHTLLYPSCTWTIMGTVFTNHYNAMDKSLCLNGFPKPVPPLALCSNVLDRPGWKV